MENNFNELSAFAYASPDKGYQNQLIGAPRIFITIYNMTESLMARKNTDKLCIFSNIIQPTTRVCRNGD